MKILENSNKSNNSRDIECDCGLEIELSRDEKTECGKCGKSWLYTMIQETGLIGIPVVIRKG